MKTLLHLSLLATYKGFVKVDWGTAFMKKQEIGGEGHRFQGRTLEQLKNMAAADDRVVAIIKHPKTQMASFLRYLEGTISPPSKSWPVYVREDLLNTEAWHVYVRDDLLEPSWKVGSYVKIVHSEVQGSITEVTEPSPAPSATGRCFWKMLNDMIA